MREILHIDTAFNLAIILYKSSRGLRSEDTTALRALFAANELAPALHSSNKYSQYLHLDGACNLIVQHRLESATCKIA